MLLSRLERSLLTAQRGPFLAPDDGSGGGGGGNDDGKPDSANPGGNQGEQGRPTFTAEQQKEIDRIAAKARREGQDAGKAEAEQARKDAEEQARKDREAADLKAKGEFEALEQTLRADLASATGERDQFKAQAARLTAAIDAVLTEEWTALGDDVREYYPGADDDPLAKLEWLPKGRALLAKLHPEKPAPGNRPDRRPNGAPGEISLDTTVEEFRRMRGMRAR